MFESTDFRYKLFDSFHKKNGDSYGFKKHSVLGEGDDHGKDDGSYHLTSSYDSGNHKPKVRCENMFCTTQVWPHNGCWGISCCTGCFDKSGKFMIYKLLITNFNNYVYRFQINVANYRILFLGSKGTEIVITRCLRMKATMTSFLHGLFSIAPIWSDFVFQYPNKYNE